jgi:hypothetical protein
VYSTAAEAEAACKIAIGYIGYINNTSVNTVTNLPTTALQLVTTCPIACSSPYNGSFYVKPGTKGTSCTAQVGTCASISY